MNGSVTIERVRGFGKAWLGLGDGILLWGARPRLDSRDLEVPPTLGPLPSGTPPDEDEDGFPVVGPVHNPGGAQERLQDLHQARGQLVHLIKQEEGAATNSEVPLDPALQVLLQERGRSLRGLQVLSQPDCFPRQELTPFPGRRGLTESTDPLI